MRPLRIELVTVRAGDTVESFARQMEVVEDPRGLFVLLNGLDRGRTLEPGDRVKLIRQDGSSGAADGGRASRITCLVAAQQRPARAARPASCRMRAKAAVVAQRAAVGAPVGERGVHVGDGAEQARLVDLRAPARPRG